MPAVSRLAATNTFGNRAVAWRRALLQSHFRFHCLQLGTSDADKIVFFTACIYRCPWGVLLEGCSGRRFIWHIIKPLSEALVPIENLVIALDFSIDQEHVKMFALEMTVENVSQTEAILFVSSAIEVNITACAGECAKKSDEEGEISVDKQDSDLESWALSGHESCSEDAVESEAVSSSSSDDDAAEVPDRANLERIAPAARAATGAFVVSHNPYFSVSNYAASTAQHAAKSLRARVAEKWATDTYLGIASKSKTIQIGEYDADPQNPRNSEMVLQAWMLWRVQFHSFLDGNLSRRRWFETELRALQRKVGHGTGNVKADKLIKQWLPAAFVA